MKTRLLALLAAAGTLWLPAIAHAAVTRAEFQTNISLIIATKKGNAAVNAIAGLLKRSIAQSPTLLVPFNTLANNAIKKIVKTPLRGKAVTALIQAEGLVYFKGRNPYNPDDPKFRAAIRTLIRTLPASQRTEIVVAQIAAGLTRLNRIKGGTDADLQSLIALVYSSAGLPPPPVS
jgi:hypothetical protein